MPKKLGRKVIAFLAVITAAQIYTFHHYNSILSGDTGSVSVPHQTTQTVAIADQLLKKYPLCAVSEDGTMAAYVDNKNQVNIYDLTANKVVSTTPEDYPVQYLKWIEDDDVFVGEIESPGTLPLYTVDASGTGTQRLVYTFSELGATDTFKAIAYTLSTNDTYVLIGSDYGSVVYHFDTNNNLTDVDLGGRIIKNIAVTTTGDVLYFEDFAEGTFNLLSYSNGTTELLYRDTALICVVDNTLYYGSLNSNGYVTAVYRYNASGQPTLMKTLKTPTLASQISVSDDGTVSTDGTPTQASTADTSNTASANTTNNTTGNSATQTENETT